jgi:hypothetical protein
LDAVLQLASRHRVTSLVYRQLNRIAPEVLQQPGLSALMFRTGNTEIRLAGFEGRAEADRNTLGSLPEKVIIWRTLGLQG